MSGRAFPLGIFQFRGEWPSRPPVDRKSHEWAEYSEQEGYLLHSRYSFPFAPFVFPQVRPGPGTSRPQTGMHLFPLGNILGLWYNFFTPEIVRRENGSAS